MKSILLLVLIAVFSSTYAGIKQADIEIYDTFSPNNDGANDQWNIGNINLYPDAVVQIFDRSGMLVFESEGDYFGWDGTYNGKNVPMGVYYFVIDLKTTGRQVRTGSINLIR